MIDLHTHTLLSDGVLVPSELCTRAIASGYKVIGITDHVDESNIEHVVQSILKFTASFESDALKVIPGVEITHVFPKRIGRVTEMARELGIKLVVCHGETIVEPVEKGTNTAAIEAGVDILAHPGLLSKADSMEAHKKGVFMEVTARNGHSLTNGHVVKMAKEYDLKMVLNTDAHAPNDLVSTEFMNMVAYGASLTDSDIDKISNDTVELISGLYV
ncbi:MAG: histidinol phosphate phosphatase domain-containing protein [Deltaproteobacteria bacterium]|nr:histidinol phosphate phosphatase domain-containing protein [Deltaproteobacteria bacterium]